MMTSLLALLRQCLPLHAAWSQAEYEAGWLRRFPTADNFRSALEIQTPGTPVIEPKAELPARTRMNKIGAAFGVEGVIAKAPIWSYSFEGSKPSATAVRCRAREQGYRTNTVLDKLSWGLEGKPEIKIQTRTKKANGEVVLTPFKLPLSEKYLFAQFRVKGGWVSKGKLDMWPLEATFDKGLIQVFIYEPDLKGGKLQEPLFPFRPRGKGKWEPVRKREKDTFEQLLPAGIKDKDAWLEAFTAPYADASGTGYKQTTATVGEKKEVEAHVARIVVVVSLGTCCERADFEPGGLIGMGKIFPNIMVSATVDLAQTEGEIELQRPARTTSDNDGDGKHNGECCNARKEIGAICVTDSNEQGGSLTQKPFWGGTFAYVQDDADVHLKGPMKIVDRSKKERTYKHGKRLLVNRIPFSSSSPVTEYPEGPKKEATDDLPWNDYGKPAVDVGVVKVEGQGEFDNIHLAPSLKLDLAKVLKRTRWEILKPLDHLSKAKPKLYPSQQAKALSVDPETCKTDKVWMAPFCSHDCFHTHWRWSRGESAKWTFGWDEGGPHRKSGAPMVPLWQDVYLTLKGPGAYNYRAKSTFPEGHPIGQWDIIMHHGAAYAQSISSFFKSLGDLQVFFSQDYDFYDSKNRKLTIGQNPELMYWLLRYIVIEKGGKAAVVPRLQFTPGEVKGARME